MKKPVAISLMFSLLFALSANLFAGTIEAFVEIHNPGSAWDADEVFLSDDNFYFFDFFIEVGATASNFSASTTLYYQSSGPVYHGKVSISGSGHDTDYRYGQFAIYGPDDNGAAVVCNVAGSGNVTYVLAHGVAEW